MIGMIRSVVMAGLITMLMSVFGKVEAKPQPQLDTVTSIDDTINALKKAQDLLDDKTLSQLEKVGDVASIKRTIEHFSYFFEAESALSFKAIIEAKDYEIEGLYKVDDEKHKFIYAVKFLHEGTTIPEDIKRRTLWISELSFKEGGWYDGWVSPVTEAE